MRIYVRSGECGRICPAGSVDEVFPMFPCAIEAIRPRRYLECGGPPKAVGVLKCSGLMRDPEMRAGSRSL